MAELVGKNVKLFLPPELAPIATMIVVAVTRQRRGRRGGGDDEGEEGEAQGIATTAKERERDSDGEMALPVLERDRETASTTGNHSTKVQCEPELVRSQSAVDDPVTEGHDVSGGPQVSFYSAKNSSLAEQTPGMNLHFE